MRVYQLFIKSIKEQIRDWRTLSLSLLMPVVFMVIFGLAFGKGYYNYKIFVINKDSGSLNKNYGNELIDRLIKGKYQDNSNIFTVTLIKSKEKYLGEIQKHNAIAIVTIPENFSQALINKNSDNKASVLYEGDPGYPSFNLVKIFLDGTLNELIKEITQYSSPVSSEIGYLVSSGSGSEFDLIAPGMMIMSIFLLIIQVAIVLIREIENKTIKRLQLTPMRTWEFLSGIGATQVLFSIFMVPLMFATAILVGFKSNGSLLNGMIIGVITSISGIAIGLIVAAFSKNTNQAFIIGNMIIVPIVFLSGTFFPLPQIYLFDLFSHHISIFDFQPATHSVNALTRIFLFNYGLKDLGWEIIMILFLTSIYFFIGVILFRTKHLKVRT